MAQFDRPSMAQFDRTSSLSHDELVVLQLLEEIHQLVLPHADGKTPSPARLHAAAKLYLDTRDTFEVIEQRVEGPAAPDRPKFLRKLSKRRGINGAATPRDSLVLPSSAPSTLEDRTASADSVSPGRSPTLSPRNPIEAALSALASSSFSSSTGTGAGTPLPSPRATDASATDPAKLEPLSEAIIDRIQDMFRHLGEMLSRAILDELRHRNLTMQSALHYVRFLPQDSQWTAYMEKREEEVQLAYHPTCKPTDSAARQLKHNAEFIKEQIRKDVNTVCLFAPDGTLSTIFGDDINTDHEAVAEKFEALVRDVYASYLQSIIDVKMEQLIRVSDQWQQDMAVMGGSPVAADAPHAQLYMRPRKFRSKIPIFPHMMTTIEDRTVMLPPTPPGQQARVLVADLNHLGIWWQKAILAATDRDITTTHTDDTRDLAGINESLDGQIYVPLVNDNYQDFLRRYAKTTGLSKWQGHRLLVNNGKDSLWVEVVVTEVDDRKCKLQLKKSIEACTAASAWRQVLAANEWIQIKDLRLCMVPLNPSFRIQMGHKFRSMLDVIHSVVVEVSSIFPNEDLERKVGKSLWQSVETSISRGEHIYARYFRSVLSQEWQPRRPTLVANTGDRSPSIVTATASVRNLVAALEHSALNQSTGSVSGPSSSTPPSTASPANGKAGAPIRRLSLSASVNAAAARSAESAFFDDKGIYHYETYVSDMPMRTTVGFLKMSPFEKLAHHLLEEKEMIGACIQSNNIALSRAFAQVLQEKLTKLVKTLQTRLEQDETSALDLVIAEYANAARFQYTWQICRHELDTATKQRRSKREVANLHAEWVDRSFERMDALVSTMLQLQARFLQRVFFHECVSYIAPGIYEQDWLASKPWFANSRCTHSVQFVLFRLQCVFESVILKLLSQYERQLGVHEKMHDMAAWLILDMLACVTTLYEHMVVSRARLTQWKMDVIYLVFGVHKLLRLLDKMAPPKSLAHDARGCKKPTTEIRELCLRLLTCLAVRTGPVDVVVTEVTSKVELESALELHVDAISEFEAHFNGVQASLGLHRFTSSTLILDGDDRSIWSCHSIFGDLELKHLADATLNYASLISRSSLSLDALLASLRHRHELGDWEFPTLTEDEAKARVRLQECVRLAEERLQSYHDTERSVEKHVTNDVQPTMLRRTPSASRAFKPSNSIGKPPPLLEGADADAERAAQLLGAATDEHEHDSAPAPALSSSSSTLALSLAMSVGVGVGVGGAPPPASA